MAGFRLPSIRAVVPRLDRSSTAREAVPNAIIRRVLQARQHPLAPEEQVVNYAMRQAIGGE